VSETTINDTVRNELLAVLAELGAACPQVRFGQLIANLSTLAQGLTAEGLWDVEDEQLLAAAREQLEYFVSRRSSGGNAPLQPASSDKS
jgi:hypothetical protein